jgi:hypothetical protein
MLKVTLKSQKTEEAIILLGNALAYWGDTCETGKTEEEIVFTMGKASIEQVESWCKAALELGTIYDYTLERAQPKYCDWCKQRRNKLHVIGFNPRPGEQVYVCETCLDKRRNIH